MIHFKSIFGKGVSLVASSVFAVLYFPGSWVKDQVTVFMWLYFWALGFVPSVYLPVYSLATTTLSCLDY